MRRLAAMICLVLGACLILGACTQDPINTTPDRASAWFPESDVYAQFGPAENPDAGPWLIFRFEVDSWTLREGEDWTTGTEIASLGVDNTDGLIVDGDRLLPDRVEVAQVEDGVEVLAIEDTEVYYGNFHDALTVDVEAGRFAGQQIFGQGFGPVAVTFDGESWELVYYE